MSGGQTPSPSRERQSSSREGAAQPFSPATVHRCWELAQGRCECQREGHGHAGRCDKPLREGRHGVLGDDGWVTTAWEQPGADQAENCEALCWPCYQHTIEEARRDTK